MKAEPFLRRVREAAQAGNRPGVAADIPPRGRSGYQGAGDDPLQVFAEQLSLVGGHVHVAPSVSKATEIALGILQAAKVSKVVLSGCFPPGMDMALEMRAAGLEYRDAADLDLAHFGEWAFSADAGVSGADYLVAETGTIVVLAGPQSPRLATLAPPIHLAVVGRDRLVADLFDVFEALATGGNPMPSCLTCITGPSKTGDIEMQLVTGVHGPGQVHVVILDG